MLNKTTPTQAHTHTHTHTNAHTNLLLALLPQPLPVPLEVLVQLRRAEPGLHELLDLALLPLDVLLAELVAEDSRRGMLLTADALALTLQGGVVGQVYLERRSLDRLVRPGRGAAFLSRN